MNGQQAEHSGIHGFSVSIRFSQPFMRLSLYLGCVMKIECAKICHPFPRTIANPQRNACRRNSLFACRELAIIRSAGELQFLSLTLSHTRFGCVRIWMCTRASNSRYEIEYLDHISRLICAHMKPYWWNSIQPNKYRSSLHMGQTQSPFANFAEAKKAF